MGYTTRSETSPRLRLCEREIHVFPVERFVYPGYDGFTGGPFISVTPRKPDIEAVLSGEGSQRPEWER